MRKFPLVSVALALMATPAIAADLGVKAPRHAPAPWSWTGFYIGANGGGGWAQSEWFEDGLATGVGGPRGLEDGS